MLAALKDMITILAAIVLLAHSVGHREWLWKQLTTIRQIALAEAREDWGCPNIFNNDACHSLK